MRCSGTARAHPCSLVEPELLAAVVVEEVHKGGRQRLGLADPGVADLARACAHEGCVSVAPSRRREQPLHRPRCVGLVAAAHQQRQAPQQDVDGQAVVPRLGPACSNFPSVKVIWNSNSTLFSRHLHLRRLTL